MRIPFDFYILVNDGKSVFHVKCIHKLNLDGPYKSTQRLNSSPKMEILSLFAHPDVVLNLCEFLSSAQHKRRDFEECNQTVDESHSLL